MPPHQSLNNRLPFISFLFREIEKPQLSARIDLAVLADQRKALLLQVGIKCIPGCAHICKLGIAALLAGLGLTFGFIGLGLVWASRGKEFAPVPETVPEAWVPKDATI